MIRKKLLIALTMSASACLLGACGSMVNKPLSTVQQGVNQEETEKSEAEQGFTDREEDKMDSKAANLTEQTAVAVTIDYNIDSYESVQNFCYQLLNSNINDKNPVLSPVSAYLALSMAGCGADGTTKDEFYDVLGNGMTALADDMMNTFPSKGDTLKISVENSAWIDDEFTVNDEWLGMIRSLMDAEAFQTDLAAPETMNQINRWIENKTNGMIDKLLSEPLDARTRLALLNTVYFKGKWQIPFEANDTYKEEFYLNKPQNESEQVDMMHLYTTDLDYISNDFAEGCILPYRTDGDQNMAFVALKPTDNNDIRDVYSKLTGEVMKDLLVNKKTELVNLKLPKFEITFDKVLNDSLKSMGLNECFDMEKADFDQMGKTQSGDNLYISLVRQKAKIIVDEEGTEAAAVTAILMECGAAFDPVEPKALYFNEPFIYMIMDIEKEIPLFIGILDNPNV